MEPAGVVAVIACALALAALAPTVLRAWRQRQRYAGLAALCLVIAAPALLAAIIAQLAGYGSPATGRFLIGMSSGLAVGLTLGSAILLMLARRAAGPLSVGERASERVGE